MIKYVKFFLSELKPLGSANGGVIYLKKNAVILIKKKVDKKIVKETVHGVLGYQKRKDNSFTK